MQKLDFSVKELVGPEHDPYFKSVCNSPLEAFEPDLYCMIKNYLSTDSIYFDVGANIGATAISIARHLEKGFVYAFEPTSAYEYLEKNIKINSLINVKSFNIALGENEGQTSFKTTAECLACSHRIIEDNCLTEPNVDSVTISRLDDIVKRESVNRVDFVKIDVEGYESNVLEGCEFIIQKFNPIFFVEFNSWCLIAFKNESPRMFLKILYEKFKNLYWIRNGLLSPLDGEAKLMEFLHANLVYNGCVDNLVCLNGDIALREKIYS